MSIRVFDFFCGCGGTSAGFQAAGMEVVMGLDKDGDSQRTFEHNFPGAAFISGDIQNINVEDVRPHVETRQRPNDLTLFCGCAPCQPFAQHKNRVADQAPLDERFSLLTEFARFVEHYRPHLIFIENVPGLQRVKTENSPFGRFLSLLERLRYGFDFGVVNALNYGVPQRRRRLVLVASRLGAIGIPEATHGPNQPFPHSTVREWIEDLPPLEPGQELHYPYNHQAANLEDINRRRIAATPVGGGRMDWPPHLFLQCHSGNHDGHSDVYGRMSWDTHCGALTTKCTSLSNGRFGHPTQNRAISVREAACLQTFDRDFRFFGQLGSTSRQVGNAVPVLMARAFGEAFNTHVQMFQPEALNNP